MVIVITIININIIIIYYCVNNIVSMRKCLNMIGC